MTTLKIEKLKDLLKIIRSLKIQLYIMIGGSIIILLSFYGFIGLSFLSDVPLDTAEVSSVASKISYDFPVSGMILKIGGGLAYFIETTIYVLNSIFFFIWIYRVSYNSRILSSENMRFGPGWAVVWFFIPIANLWKPYQVLKELLKVNASSLISEKEKKRDLLYLKYGWITHIFNSYLFFIMILIGAMLSTSIILIILVFLALPIIRVIYWVFHIKLINRLAKLQMLKKEYILSQEKEIATV